MKKQIVACLVLALLPACAVNDVTARRVPFPVSEYAALKTDGSSAIRGQVFIETRCGDRVPKSGAKVVLNPVTSYSTQWYKETAVMKQRLDTPDPRLSGFIKEAVTDDEGRFKITGIPAGEYYVSSPLVWEGPRYVGSETPMVPQGRFVVKRIVVSEKEQVDVSLKCAIRLDEENIDASKPSSEKMQFWTALLY